jgi:alpha-L-fucosidase 2
MIQRFVQLFFITVISAPAITAQNISTDDLKLWYTQPASTWNEALPVGNGRLGAMVFGGINHERIQLNEETVWSGRKEDFVNPRALKSLPVVRKLLFEGKYAEAQKLAQTDLMGNKTRPSSYQTLGDLHFQFDHASAVTDYRRDLDLETAVSTIEYKVANVTFRREIYVSAPDNVMIIRLTADKPGTISFALDFTRPGNKALIEATDSTLSLSEHVGNGEGTKIFSALSAKVKDGRRYKKENTLYIAKASEVVLYLTAATDYRGLDPKVAAVKSQEKALAKSIGTIRTDHISDYQKYFQRLSLDLGKTESTFFPTDQRLAALQRGNYDPQLITLYYQYGRYLLISSSRPGGLPANLQGIWADGLTPPWDADYHININIQMNYWPSEITNLSELHVPFLEFLDKMRPDARNTAKQMYGIEGTVAHFTTDAWHFTEPYGQTQWAMWPMGMAWSAQHAWEHFLFTEDETYLRTLGYPLLKDAATFCVNWLVAHPATKQLVSGPSISPENTFRTANGDVATMVMGPTMDHMIIRQLLNSTIRASERLNVDAPFRKKMEQVLTRLAPTKVGSDGRIMEWTEEFAEPEPGHRHISHLYGLYPGNEINTKVNPPLMAAAEKTIAHRLANGGGHTGWSRAWIINYFARLSNAEKAHENLLALMRKSTLPNLFDNHPPFQIDGNFGATAGITEMLVQSQSGEIILLPALPKEWKDGSIKGVCARGGFELDITWKDGKLVNVVVHSKLGNECIIRYGDKVVTRKTTKGMRFDVSDF